MSNTSSSLIGKSIRSRDEWKMSTPILKNIRGGRFHFHYALQENLEISRIQSKFMNKVEIQIRESQLFWSVRSSQESDWELSQLSVFPASAVTKRSSNGARVLGQISRTFFFSQCVNARTFTVIVMKPLWRAAGREFGSDCSLTIRPMKHMILLQ